jgi:chloramphenicol 3-O-phosphotransferase
MPVTAMSADTTLYDNSAEQDRAETFAVCPAPIIDWSLRHEKDGTPTVSPFHTHAVR